MITKKRITITIDADILKFYRAAFPSEKLSTEINRFMGKRVKRAFKKEVSELQDMRQLPSSFKKAVIL